MIVEGYCVTGRADEPMDAHGFCLSHGMVGIPPSWGDRRWCWTDGTWQPYKPRPEGYVYRPKYVDEPPKPKPVTARQTTPVRVQPTECGQCGAAIQGTVRGGSVQLYCSPLCKSRAGSARRREARRAAAR